MVAGQEKDAAVAASTEGAQSAWRPFHHATFTVMWTATVVANIGTWMYNAASGWLMTSLAPDPLVVSLVQVATSLPMAMLALPAGALADVLDRRRLLIVTELVTTAVAALFAGFVWLDLVTPWSLLLFTFLISVGSVLVAPAWQAIVPQLVPKQDLAPAVTANSVGFNVSRAIGPALGGAIIVSFGIAAPFWINAVSNFAVVGALLWWRSTQKLDRHLPAERFGNAIITGVRYGRHNPQLRATMARAVGFFLFSSAYWALLPLVARSQIAGGPQFYGVLLGVIGAGAVIGGFLLPRLKATLGPDRTVSAATIGSALALALFGIAHDEVTGVAASFIAGVSWISALASLNVSAQASLPEWVRGRGIAFYMTVMFGSLTLGSMLWGEVAGTIGLSFTLLIAGAGALAVVPLTRRWKLQAGAGGDLTPSLHWPAPVTTREIEQDRGPVMVSVEYRIDLKNRDSFLTALEVLAHERRRDGAYAWGIFEDAADDGRFIETFFVESWLEHLRQHERVTNTDRVLQDSISHFQAVGVPKVSHFIAAQSGEMRAGFG